MARVNATAGDLEGRVVLMTGADRGLGRAMSLGLAEKGTRVVLASPAFDGLKGVAAVTIRQHFDVQAKSLCWALGQTQSVSDTAIGLSV